MSQPDAASPVEIVVRPCFQQDLDMVRLIYAHHVLTGTGSFAIEPPDLEEIVEKWSEVVTRGWPYVVACPSNDLTRVLGFAYASQYRPRPGYAKSFEDSVYVAPGAEKRGAGYKLLGAVLSMLQQDGAREVLAFIGDSENAASIALHRKLGFVQVGLLNKVGEKFGRMLDVVVMQRGLVYATPPYAPLPEGPR